MLVYISFNEDEVKFLYNNLLITITCICLVKVVLIKMIAKIITNASTRAISKNSTNKNI